MYPAPSYLYLLMLTTPKDTNFLSHTVRAKLPLVETMMDCLYAACTPIITDCVMAELTPENDDTALDSPAARAGRRATARYNCTIHGRRLRTRARIGGGNKEARLIPIR